MIRKFLLVVAACVALNALLRVGDTRPGLLVGMVASWALCAYLVARAWPAVRRDLGSLRGVLAGRRGPRLRRRDAGGF